MSDLGDGRLGALLTLLDLVLDAIPRPERRHAFLVHFRECIMSRERDAEQAVRRERGKTPPPRRPSGAFQALHSRAQTEPHNTQRLVEENEAERELGERETPVCEPPLKTTYRHPSDDR